jgi:hypothetical protein
VRHSGNGINLCGGEGKVVPTRRITIANNLFVDINGERWGGSGVFLLIGYTDDVRVEHNTSLQSGTMVWAYGPPSRRFVFRDNVMAHNATGLLGDGVGVGMPAMVRYFPDMLWDRNALIGAPRDLYPAETFFPSSAQVLRFVDPASGDFRLSKESPLHRQATDGMDVGWNAPASLPR